MARVQFIEEIVGFVEIWHASCESIIHVPFVERRELVFLFYFSSVEHMKVLANSGPSGEPMAPLQLFVKCTIQLKELVRSCKLEQEINSDKIGNLLWWLRHRS